MNNTLKGGVEKEVNKTTDNNSKTIFLIKQFLI
jgi:hypothetical protein